MTLGIGYIDGTRQSSTYGFVNYIALDGQNNVYVSDHYDDFSGAPGYPLNSIRRISIGNPNNVTTLAGKKRKSPTLESVVTLCLDDFMHMIVV
jgi:hypothetical protein